MDSCRVLLKLTVSALLLTATGVAQAQLYWRADLGYSFSTSADIRDKSFVQTQGICGDANCTVPGKIDDVGNSAILGGGVGWRFNPNLRADATLGYRGWYKVDQTMPNRDTIKADVSSWNLMLNGYYDFALAWGKPYVGVGLGLASNKVDDAATANPVLRPGITRTVPGGTKSGLAWGLMAGVGVPVGANLTLDLGVRYIDLGKLETDRGPFLDNGVATGLTYSGAEGKLRAWELTVGMRF